MSGVLCAIDGQVNATDSLVLLKQRYTRTNIITFSIEQMDHVREFSHYTKGIRTVHNVAFDCTLKKAYKMNTCKFIESYFCQKRKRNFEYSTCYNEGNLLYMKSSNTHVCQWSVRGCHQHVYAKRVYCLCYNEGNIYGKVQIPLLSTDGMKSSSVQC